LGKFAKKDTVSPLKACQIMAQVFGGAAYLHQRGVIHTDIKPQNILYNAVEDRARLCDLGSAVVNLPGYRSNSSPKSIQEHGLAYGTLPYRSPEILLGHSSFGTAVDVWALACTLAELCLRERFFAVTHSAIGMIFNIFQKLGSPAVGEELVFYSALPLWTGQMPQFSRRSVPSCLLEHCSLHAAAAHVVDGSFRLHPLYRMTAWEAQTLLEQVEPSGPEVMQVDGRGFRFARKTNLQLDRSVFPSAH
jgi:serine/threonine protein kinase